ncbi:MAG: response regulator transcription factor [Bacteroidetes bacterium]|nr:response regulator transcription factor [Bacteroidota bacterium]MBS1632522.1 response regulator transcription factor [Bacteroidota bacterium]
MRILLVEDERKIADALKSGLQENGYDTEVAYDGDMGFRMFKNQDYDLIILDINLPVINGYELCRMIRRKNDNILVLMLTAMSSVGDKLEGFNTGADDYLVKPFEFKELLARIRALLKRKSLVAPTGNKLTIADLEMNLDSKEVIRNGKVIKLTAKEFQLLEYFLRNHNRVLSRADIALQVWGLDFDSKTNVIDVYVNYLRNKIDKNFPEKLLHTMVGMGYVLKVEN